MRSFNQYLFVFSYVLSSLVCLFCDFSSAIGSNTQRNVLKRVGYQFEYCWFRLFGYWMPQKASAFDNLMKTQKKKNDEEEAAIYSYCLSSVFSQSKMVFISFGCRFSFYGSLFCHRSPTFFVVFNCSIADGSISIRVDNHVGWVT